MSPIRVAIFEDNKHLRETLQLLLNQSGAYYCSGAFANCNSLVKDLQATPCDIVLMDIEMPGISGIPVSYTHLTLPTNREV